MLNISKSGLNTLNIAKAFFLLFLVALFFPIRYVFPTPEAFQTGAYSDFTSISLYLSDIFLILSAGFTFLPRGREILKSLFTSHFLLFTFIFWLTLGIILHFAHLSSLNWWFFGKYLELAVSYGTAYYLFKETDIKPLFLKLFVYLASFQSLLTLWQFHVQHSVGGTLNKVGEQVLSPTLQGIAKIVSGETAFIRGYGTFPHPNLLSAFLLVGVLFTIYLLSKAKSSKNQVLYGILLLLNVFGLTVTFSRASFLALAFALVIFFGISTWKNYQKAVWIPLGVTLLSIILSFWMFYPFLSTRATVSDSASLERIFYAKLGLGMIQDHPILGIGIGESVLHMQQYAPMKLWPWQIQPIHNYFLLAAAEIGILGALLLISLFLSHLWGLLKKLKSIDGPLTTYYLLLTTILISFLVLMQFDHYFYTLGQTQMLLWITLGIIAAQIKSPSKEGD